MRSPGACRVSGVGSLRVPRWSETAPGAPPDYSHLGPNHLNQPYPYLQQINDRLAIWHGDMTRLSVDVMVNSTDETLLESNVISDRVIAGAGPTYKEEITNGGYECSVGSVCVTGGYSLPCVHLVHTVCPSYRHSDRHAAETALQNCYRNILSMCVSLKCASVCIPALTSPRPDFPPDVAAHIALRTVRGHVERSPLPAVVVLSTESAADVSLWTTLAPLYFPRSQREANANRWRLPADAVSERRIRIIHNPHITPEDDTSYDDSTSEAAVLFARAVSSDTTRLLAPPAAPLDYTRHLHEEQYDRLLRRAQTEDLSEVSGIGCLYQSGVDRLGRPVVVFIGKWFPIADINLDKALLYLIKLLDPIVRGDYVIAYFHTLASSTNHPPFSWLKEVYTVLPYKYKKNLKAFYIIHPTFWTKMMTWWFLTFMAPAIKTKVQTLPGVEYLYSVLARDQLEVPAFVTEYDMTINGLHYFQPELNSSST